MGTATPTITAPSRWHIGGQGHAHLDPLPPPEVLVHRRVPARWGTFCEVGQSASACTHRDGITQSSFPALKARSAPLRPLSLESWVFRCLHSKEAVCVSKWPLILCKKCFIVAKKSLLFLNFTFAKHLNKVQSEITHTNFWDNENFKSDQTSLIYRYINAKLCISKNYQSDNLNSALLEFIKTF